MEDDLLAIVKIFGSTGVGGIVAGLVLWWKRLDDKRTAARERQYGVELAAMLARQENYSRDLVAVVRDNTAALTALAERLESREVSHRRRQP